MLPRRELIALSLLALSLGAWASVVLPTVNYLQYYRALGDLTLTIESMNMTPGSSNVTVTFLLKMSNPTSYVGIGVATLAYQALLPNGTETIVMGVGGEGVTGRPLLRPMSSISLTEQFVISGLRFQQYQSLYNNGNGTLNWTIRGALGLDTRDGDLTYEFEIPFTTTPG